MSRKYLLSSFVNKVYDNRNKVYYLQKNRKCYNLETTFQKKVNLSQYSKLRSYQLTTFQTPVTAVLLENFILCVV